MVVKFAFIGTYRTSYVVCFCCQCACMRIVYVCTCSMRYCIVHNVVLLKFTFPHLVSSSYVGTKNFAFPYLRCKRSELLPLPLLLLQLVSVSVFRLLVSYNMIYGERAEFIARIMMRFARCRCIM